MLAARVLIAFLFVAVLGEEGCAGKGCPVDDVTSLLQTHVELTQGGSSGKPEKLISEGIAGKKEALKEQSDAYGQSTTGDWKKGYAEFIGMMLYVFIGCGTAMSTPEGGGKVFHVALAFGFANAAVSYAISHYSGICQINTAVTFALWQIGNEPLHQAVINTFFQLAGACCGALLLTVVFPPHLDCSRVKATGAGGLNVNAISTGFHQAQALLAELMGTFILVFVLMETKVNQATIENRSLASLAIGIANYLAHSVLIPIDGCSVNPARSFGPMMIRRLFRDDATMKTEAEQKRNDAYITDHWVFWVGPLLGAFFATLAYHFLHEGS